jgi:hypothetical protein
MNPVSTQSLPRTARAPLAASLATALAMLLPGAALADAVTEWNEFAGAAAATAGAPPVQNRIMAIVQIAVHDAVNAVEPRYQTYTARPAAPAGASAPAAAIAAAYRATAALVPAQAAGLKLKYDHRIAELPACASSAPNCITDGIAAGFAAADDILALRAADGAATPHRPYTLPAGPGVYQPTPPQLAAPAFAGWAEVEPFALESGNQFRVDTDEAIDLSTAAYARDFNEVKVDGSSVVRSANPDSEQSRIARYWPGGGANYNGFTRVIVAGRGLDLWQHARLFALLNMAVSDATVAVFETKFFYNFWRPVTAIRAADSDGNAATSADPTWVSYQATPPYPDYACGLPSNIGAATEVLRRYFDTNALPYTFTAGGITRSFKYLPQVDAEAVDARVFGGMHFRTGCVQGIRLGAKVGRFVFQHQLGALNGPGAR